MNRKLQEKPNSVRYCPLLALATSAICFSFSGLSNAQETPTEAESEPEGDIVVLDSFNVLADSERRGYQSNLIIGADRLAVSIDDIAAAAFVINSQMIEDLNPRYITDVVKYVAGVEQPRYYPVIDDVVIRSNETPTSFVDGFPVRGLTYVPTALVEQFEIIKGPQGVLYGTVSAGGLINRVIKSPRFEQAGELKAEFGSWGYYSGTLDLTGPLGENENIAYRFIASRREGGGRQPNLQTDRPDSTIASGLKFALPDGGSIWIQYEFNDRETTFADNVTYGDPVTGLLDEDLHRKYARYTSLKTSTDYYRIATIAEKKIGPIDTRFSYQYNSSNWKDDALFAFSQSNFGPIGARFRDQSYRVHSYFFDGVWQPEFDAGVSNTINFGVSHQKEKTASLQLSNFGPALEEEYGLHDIFNPPLDITYIHDSPNSATNLKNEGDNKFTSIYGNWRASFADDRVKVIGGFRYQDYSVFVNNQLGGEKPQKDDTKTLFKFGVVGKVSEGVNVYYGYGETFRPSTGLGFIPEGSTVKAGDFLPDPGAENHELGIKISRWDRRLNLSGTFYQLSQTGRTGSGSSSLLPIVPLPDSTNSGFEFQLTAEPVDGWQIIASFTAAKVRKADGSRSTDISETIANFWTKYNVSEGSMEGLGFGFGVNYYGDKVPLAQPGGTGGGKTGWLIPAVTTVDAMVSFDRDEWRFAINGRNIGDKIYVTRLSGSFAAMWVSNGRTWDISATRRW
jgi:iron complex outermembrane receptor protein